MPEREEDDREKRLDKEIRELMEDYTEEDRAFLEEMWENIKEYNQ